MLFVTALQDALNASYKLEGESNAFIEEEEDTSLVKRQQLALLPVPLEQLRGQRQAQQFITDISSNWQRILSVRPLLAGLPLVASTLSSTWQRILSTRALPARLPQHASSLSPARLQISSLRPLLVRLPQIAASLAWSLLLLLRPLLVRLPLLAASLSAAWSRLPSPRPLFDRLSRLATLLSSALPRPLRDRLSQLAAAFSSAWSLLPLPGQQRNRLPQSVSVRTSAWSLLPPPHPQFLASLPSAQPQSPLPRPQLASPRGRRRLVSIKLPLIFFIALLVLASIFVPIFTFRLSTPPATTHKVQNQSLIIKLTAMSDTDQVGDPVIISLRTRKSKPTAVQQPGAPATPIGNASFATPATPIDNASFETPALAGDYRYVPPGSSWTFSSGAGIASNGSNITQGVDNAPDGKQVAFIQAQSSLSQNVTFIGGKYTVSFLAAQSVGSASTQSLIVCVDNTSIAIITPTGARYLRYSTPSFTVTAGIHMLQFKGLGAGAHNIAFIDSVTLEKG